MGKASSQSKDLYNEATYSRYTIRVRKDSDLYVDIEDFMSKKGSSLNYLVLKLLDEHFAKLDR